MEESLPLWRRDGKELFYRSGNKIMAVSLQLDPDLAIGKPRMLFDGVFERNYDVTADGQRFIMVKNEKAPPQIQINVRPQRLTRRGISARWLRQFHARYRSYELSRDSKPCPLRPKALELLQILIGNRPKAMSHAELYDRL